MERHPGSTWENPRTPEEREIGALKAENEALSKRIDVSEANVAKLRALLEKADAAIEATRHGKRDGGTFGNLSTVSDEIRAALVGTPPSDSAATQDGGK